MSTFVFTVLNTNGARYEISTLGPQSRVSEIKEAVADQTTISKEMIVLIHKGGKPADDATLEQARIQPGSVVNMALFLKAG